MSLMLFSTAVFQLFMLKLLICSSQWSFFTYVTGIRPKFYKVSLIVGIHILLSMLLAPYIGEVTVGLLVYLVVISINMPRRPFMEFHGKNLVSLFLGSFLYLSQPEFYLGNAYPHCGHLIGALPEGVLSD